jgi:hypothetical protein
MSASQERDRANSLVQALRNKASASVEAKADVEIGPDPQPGPPPMEPMVPLLTGWLLGALDKDGRDAMKIVECVALPPDRFQVTFASGLVLEVVVAVAPERKMKEVIDV